MAKVIFMGDLNDAPHVINVRKVLGAKKISEVLPSGLYNPMWRL